MKGFLIYKIILYQVLLAIQQKPSMNIVDFLSEFSRCLNELFGILQKNVQQSFVIKYYNIV